MGGFESGFGDDESEFGSNDEDGSVSAPTTATATASSSGSASRKLKYPEINREIKRLKNSRSKYEKSHEKIDNVVSSLQQIIDKKKNEDSKPNYIQKMCEFEEQRQKIAGSNL